MGNGKWIAVAALAAAAASLGVPAAAHTTVGVQIGVPVPVYPQAVYPAPVYVRPAPVVVYEPVPARRDYWGWQGNGYAQAPRHIHIRGDRDGDGVPNRWDRAPSNPWRY